ncbi:hypothetical protein [Streptococcus suis]|uniref:hypothetical protein n=1 Tax=Streptococcus suis TaxID=1307 RepID=UPI003757D469
MGKKLIKSTAIGVATLISFVIANGVHAEEDVNTPTSPVESPEVSLTASVGIEDSIRCYRDQWYCCCNRNTD